MRSAEERNVAILEGPPGATTSKPMQGDQAQAKGSVGGDVKLSDRQRTTIRDTVLHGRSAPLAIGHVDFNVRVGTIVPRKASDSRRAGAGNPGSDRAAVARILVLRLRG